MDDVDKIKQKIDIVELISEYVPLKKTGRNYKACCPFHNEKTPSFIVSPERQIWHCFGCQKGGDVFRFLMERENMEFVEALRFLAQKAGVTLTQRADTGLGKTKERIYQINHLASEYYHYLLLHHKVGKKALSYILGRGLKERALETFKIGYAPDSWDSLLKYLIGKGYKKEEIEEAGLIIKNEKGTDYYDRFRHRLMFTLKDHRNNVVGFAGRIFDSNSKEAPLRQDFAGQAKYINTPETPVYIKGNVLYGLDITREAIKKANQAIVVEGEIDLIASWQEGVTNIVAIKGSAFTQGQVELLKRYTSSILLALDMDLAGDLAARRGIAMAEQAGLAIKVIIIPGAKDPADCIFHNPADWKKAIKEAISIYDFYIAGALKKYDAQTAEGKKQISVEVLPFLKNIDNLVMQAHYVKILAKILAVSEELLYEQMRKQAKEDILAKPTTKEEQLTVKMTRRETLENYILAYFLQSDEPKKLSDFIKTAQTELKLTAQQKIIVALREFLTSPKTWEIKKFYEGLPQELVAICDVCYLWNISLENNDDYKDLQRALQELRSLNLHDKLAELSQRIKTVKEEKELAELTREFQAVLQQLQTTEAQMG